MLMLFPPPPLSLSLSVVATSAAFVSACREQLGHDSQSAQHPSSSGKFNSRNRNNTFIKPKNIIMLASHLPHIPEYLSILSGAAEDISDNSKKGEMLDPY